MATTKKATTKKATATTNEKDDKAKIAELLKKLDTATGQGEKRAIRRSLRALGHRGGLGKKPTPPNPKAKGKAKPKTTKKGGGK